MVLPAVIILLCFAIFPLIVSVYLSLCRFALAGGSFTLTFIGLYNYKRLLVRRAAISFPRHDEADRDAGMDRPSRSGPRSSSIGSAATSATRLHVVRLRRPARLGGAGDRNRDGRAGDAARRRIQGTLLTTCLLRARRRRRAIRPRPRAGAVVRPADPRPQFLPRRLLHSADGDAGRRRLHVPHARRHAEGTVRAGERRARTRRAGRGRRKPGRRGSWW